MDWNSTPSPHHHNVFYDTLPLSKPSRRRSSSAAAKEQLAHSQSLTNSSLMKDNLAELRRNSLSHFHNITGSSSKSTPTSPNQTKRKRKKIMKRRPRDEEGN
jgi:hypothetical protein